MRALQMVAAQQPPELRQVPEPEPGPGEVLVRVEAAGACHSDLHLLDDIPDGLVPWPLPCTLGHEIAGRVEALGAGATGVEVGEPVAVLGAVGCGRCERCLAGADHLCVRGLGHPALGLGLPGGMAELVVAPSVRHVVPIGDVPATTAAALTDAGLTPYHAITRSLPLLVPGSHAVVIGVGGLGHVAVQLLAALSPATVIAVDARPEALALAAQGGATHVVAAGDGAAAEVLEATGGRRAELVLDVVGVDATLALAAAVVRSLGHVTLLGIGGGTLPWGYFTAPLEVSFTSTYWGSAVELAEVVALAAQGLVVPHVATFALEEGPEVYDRLRGGDIDGRAVLVP